jgi:hypothetical protein
MVAKFIHATGQSNARVETIKEWVDPESNQFVTLKWRTSGGHGGNLL